MLAVGIKRLKNQLSEYVRRVRNGEVVLVTDRDEVVAELIPPRPGRTLDPTDAQLAELARSGLVRPRIRRYVPPRDRPPTGLRLNDVMRGLDADREERG